MTVPSTPTNAARQYAVLLRFYRQQPSRHTRQNREVYDLVREVTETRRAFCSLMREGRAEMARRLADTRANRQYSGLQRVNERIGDFRHAMTAIVEARSLDQANAIAVELQRIESVGPAVKRAI